MSASASKKKRKEMAAEGSSFKQQVLQEKAEMKFLFGSFRIQIFTLRFQKKDSIDHIQHQVDSVYQIPDFI